MQCQKHFFPVLVSDHLSVLVRVFRSLLILDDVWESTVLKVFDVQCRILLTTRNRSLTDSVSGTCTILLAIALN